MIDRPRWLHTALPIIQAPMAGAQGSALAIAVSNAGGLGSLPAAMLTLEALRDELLTLAAHTRNAFNVNFFCHMPPTADSERETRWREALMPYYREFGIDASAIPIGPGRAPFTDETADVIAPFKPPFVSFHFGLPAPKLLARVKGWGSTVLSSATTVAEARWLEAHGVDAVIAQGLEAGGHRGHFLSSDLALQSATFALLPAILRAVNCPVIAAGGIADAAAVARALTLGAQAVQIGTAYLLCAEATTSKTHRAALQSPAAHHTALTNLFTGRPARGIVNRLMREMGSISSVAPAFPLAVAAVAPLRAKAEHAGSGDFSPLWAGQNVTGCKEVSAALLTREMAGPR